MQYAELVCKTNFSFLTGASRPGELMERAKELGLSALAITDRNGVYGMPRAYRAVKDWARDGVEGPLPRLLVGAELTLGGQPPLTLLARDRVAYGLLCRMITAAHAGKPKGEALLSEEELVTFLTKPGAKGLIALPTGLIDPQTYPHVHKLVDLFPGRLYLPLARLLDGWDKNRYENVIALAKRHALPIVATNDVHYHLSERRRLQDCVTAIRHGVTLRTAGKKLFSNAERRLKSPLEMQRLFRHLPEALRATLEIAESCTFSPSELRYRYPSEWIPAGLTAQGHLEQLVWDGAKTRYPQGAPPEVRRQLIHELSLINRMGFADYFLTIWEIVEFARSRGILCQGRGSAANSVVCYCLGVTAIDPVRMNLLFERFISEERGEPPDIDVDFEHERREEVIQHIYEKYGRDRAAMVAAVIRYRSRSGIREVTKVLETDRDNATALKLVEELYDFPRHLSIHSGGFTLSADPLIETVPVEPARMEGRTIVQWDKDDLDAIGLLKIDILALGMLSAIRKCCAAVGKPYETLPAEDPATYRMIQKADTIGVFQIESRAQMNMLGRLQPANFYDLVIQIAIVRPGPIVGKMVHPYLRRRRGEESSAVPHPKLEPILRKTLGVPLFQEQVMKMAIELAGFSAGEADELRRAMGTWRSSGSIERMGEKLMGGLLRSGLTQEYVERIFAQIKGFAEYGFPESHSASFALLAYASAYLKHHHPAEFCCSLMNSQPMGFYSDHTLVDDAKRHGVTVLPVHPNLSEWDSVVRDGKLQVGLRVVSGLGEGDGRKLVVERERRPFGSLADFLARVRLHPNVLHRLAMGDAFACFGFDQRHALWEILAHQALAAPEPTGQLSLFSGVPVAERRAGPGELFQGLDRLKAIESDYGSYRLSTRGHPMTELRARLPQIPRHTTRQLKEMPNGRVINAAGLTIVRQRPQTANDTVFATLEDEDGLLDLVLHKNVHEKYADVFSSAFLIARGVLHRDRHSTSLIVKSLRTIWEDSPMSGQLETLSHDWR
ncbi:MAG: PHP domain-containing protein [Deltaproteobacteria bacterium]|nr:PHP domain-containing protein [Deltaproteobacteria bacterium]